MKKIVLALTMLFLATGAMFAQSDLQALAIVKLNKNETITLKQVKNRCEVYEKQLRKSLTADERKMVFDTLIEEKLMIQAAQKAGINIPDSTVDQYFMQTMSQSLGVQVTEKELNDLLVKNQNKTLDEVLIEQTGMNRADYKTYLKNSLMMQQYVAYQSKEGLQKVVPTDEEIRLAYESNKSSFVWNDMAKAILVRIPKSANLDSNIRTANDLLNQYKEKKLTVDQILIQSQKEGAGYAVAECTMIKNEESARSLGMSMQALLTFFNYKEGQASEVEETETDFRFMIFLKKYDAKMLAISDIVQPETTVTVYDYIRSLLTQQKQAAYLNQQLQVISKSLNTAENVELKKSGAALEKLLKWGE